MRLYKVKARTTQKATHHNTKRVWPNQAKENLFKKNGFTITILLVILRLASGWIMRVHSVHSDLLEKQTHHLCYQAKMSLVSEWTLSMLYSSLTKGIVFSLNGKLWFVFLNIYMSYTNIHTMTCVQSGIKICMFKQDESICDGFHVAVPCNDACRWNTKISF